MEWSEGTNNPMARDLPQVEAVLILFKTKKKRKERCEPSYSEEGGFKPRNQPLTQEGSRK